MSKTTVPEKLYLGLSYPSSTGEMVRAQMTPWGEDKASKSRMNTIDKTIARYNGGKKLEAQVIDNTPAYGFRITDKITYPAYGSSNQQILIQDPRGFEVPTPVKEFAPIFKETVIDKGEILAECVWIRQNSENVLVATSSERYEEAMSNTKTKAMKETWRNVQIGDKILMKDNTQGVWLGKMHAYTEHKNYTMSRTPSGMMDWSDDVFHIVIMDAPSKKSNNPYHARYNRTLVVKKTLQLAQILERNAISVAEAERRANECLRDKQAQLIYSGYNDIHALSTDKAKSKMVSLELVKSDISTDQELSNALSYSAREQDDSGIFMKKTDTDELILLNSPRFGATKTAGVYTGYHYRLSEIQNGKISPVVVDLSHKTYGGMTQTYKDIKTADITPDYQELYNVKISFTTEAGAQIEFNY